MTTAQTSATTTSTTTVTTQTGVTTTTAKDPNKYPTLSFENVTAKAGDTITFKMLLTDNEVGITSLNAWFKFNSDYFEFVSIAGGDPTVSGNNRKGAGRWFVGKMREGSIDTVAGLYNDDNVGLTTGDMIMATIVMKVKDNCPDGSYPLTFDRMAANEGINMCIALIDGEQKELFPNYVDGQITVGAVETTTTPVTTVTTTTTTPVTTVTTTTTTPVTTVTTTETTTTTPVTTVTTTSETTTTTSQVDGVSFEVGKVSGKAGETVYVPIIMSGNKDGVSGINLELKFDKDSLELVDCYTDDVPVLPGSWTASKTSGYIVFVTGTGRSEMGNGTVGLAEFKIKDTAAEAVYPVSIGYAKYSKQADGTQLSFDPAKLTAGSITVGNPVLRGDVDGNGIVGMLDLVKLKKYLLKAAPITDVPYGDVSQDGNINAIDLTMLLQILLNNK